jgi:hypothetical protein
MAAVAKNDAVRSFLNKGFGEAQQGSKHHRRFVYIVNENALFKTYVSHGSNKDLNDYLIGKMADDCHLTKEEFKQFVLCRISKEQYRQILIDRGVIKE